TVASNKTGCLEEAEEIVQDIFISLWDRREEIIITTSLNAYLAVSVKYRVIKLLAKRNQYNKYAVHSLTILPLSTNSTEDWFEFEELKSRLEILVSNLPEKCRLVYKASREEGFSQKQIAEEFGISEKTVEAHIGKALKSLRTGLGQIFL
ncbi:MAG: sigma-70 family RNA polymerase sigma factor, partial [Pedobacter sp.]